MSHYWLNQFFSETQKAEGLSAFRADPQAYLQRYQLSPELQEAVMRVDVATMYQAGANPYLLRFFCVNMGVPESAYLDALHGLR